MSRPDELAAFVPIYFRYILVHDVLLQYLLRGLRSDNPAILQITLQRAKARKLRHGMCLKHVPVFTVVGHHFKLFEQHLCRPDIELVCFQPLCRIDRMTYKLQMDLNLGHLLSPNCRTTSSAII